MVNPRRHVRLRHVGLVLAILAAVTPLIAGHLGAPAIGATAVVPGTGMADIALGQPIAEVLNRFGTPSAVRTAGPDGLLEYGFDKYGITVYAHGDIVQAVATTNSLISGNGIGLGTPLTEVLKAMGTEYSPATIEGFPGIVYRGSGIGFGLDRDSVASILVFKAMVAAPAPQPAAPTGQSGPSASSPVVNPSASAPSASSSANGETGAAPIATAASQAGASSTANTATAGTVFDVSQLHSFTAASHYLSLNGYLRLLMHRSSWMSRQDADRLLRDGYNKGVVYK